MSSDPTFRLKTQLAEIFDSNDQEWITAISMIVDVMYQEFIRERQESPNNDGPLEKKTMEAERNSIRGPKRGLGRAV